jgi:hypothetical protein
MAYDKIVGYKFKPILKAIVDGEDQEIDVSSNIKKIVIQSDYKNRIFPIMKMQLILNASRINFFKDNEHKLKFKLDLNRYKSQEVEEEESYTFYDNYIKDLILKPFNLNLSKVTTSENDTNHEIVPSNQLELTFFSVFHLNYNKKVHNKVFRNCQMKDVLLYFLDQNTDGKKLLLKQPDNGKKYEQVIVPPDSLTNIFYYLNRNYGIYNSGMKLFFDYNKHYLISNDFKNEVAVTPDEYDTVIFNVLNPDSVRYKNVNFGIFEDEESKKYEIIMRDTIEKINATDGEKEIFGEELSFHSIDKNSHFNDRDVENKRITRNDRDDDINFEQAKEKVLWNPYSHEYIEREYKHRTEQRQTQFKIPLAYFKLDLITPNKKYIIKYKEEDNAKKFNGTYHLNQLNYQFVRLNNYEYFDIYGVGLFERVLD